jgi:hypothetical protein
MWNIDPIQIYKQYCEKQVILGVGVTYERESEEGS